MATQTSYPNEPRGLAVSVGQMFGFWVLGLVSAAITALVIGAPFILFIEMPYMDIALVGTTFALSVSAAQRFRETAWGEADTGGDTAALIEESLSTVSLRVLLLFTIAVVYIYSLILSGSMVGLLTGGVVTISLIYPPLDYAVLKRIGISPAVLPAVAVVILLVLTEQREYLPSVGVPFVPDRFLYGRTVL